MKQSSGYIQSIMSSTCAGKGLLLKNTCIAASVRPLVEAYFSWLKELAPKINKGSATGRALTYSLNQEKYVKVFLDNPIVRLDNNYAEWDAIRPFVICRV